jgi:anti-sigma factor RsiW
VTTIDDETLSAWLDGEADDAAAVEAWLREHPEDAARTRLWAGDAAALRERLAPVAAEPVPPALQALVMESGRTPRWRMAAAAAGLLVAGGLVGSALTWRLDRADPLLAAGTPAGWVERAAYAHAVFTPEPRHPVEVKAQEAHLSRWLTARIQVPVKLFDLTAQGYELVGGRLLPDGPGKSAQLMYQNTQGVRVTVYLRKPEADADTAFRYERHGELGLFYWVEAGAGYALVGTLPRDELLALAQAIHQQLPAPAAASKPRS